MAKNYVYDNALEGIPVKCYEGTATRSDAVGPNGLIIEDAITYSAPLEKGDKVIIKDDENSDGEIVVEAFTPGNEANNCIGELADDPRGVDDVTTSGGTPAHAQRRTATLKIYAVAVDMFTADGAQTAGYAVVYKESGTSMTLTSASAVPSANGQMVALAHAATGVEFPVALGYFGFQPAD